MKERVRFPPKAMDIINHTYYISGEPVLLQDTHGDLGIMSSNFSWNATGIYYQVPTKRVSFGVSSVMYFARRIKEHFTCLWSI